MTNRALVVIDLINDHLDRWDTDKATALISKTNTLVGAFRRSGLPVIWVREEFRPDLSDAFLEMRDNGIKIAIEGTHGAQFHPDLDWNSVDITIVKKRYSAFFRTGLEALLEDLGVGELVLCGINTHACVRMTAIDAYQRDLRVVLAEECVGSYSEEHALVSLAYMNGKIAKVSAIIDIIGSLELIAALPAD